MPLPGDSGDLPGDSILYFVTSKVTKVQPQVLPGTAGAGGHFSCKSLGRFLPHNLGHLRSEFRHICMAPGCWWYFQKNHDIFPRILATAFNTSTIPQVQLKNKTHPDINCKMITEIKQNGNDLDMRVGYFRIKCIRDL